MRTTLTIEPEVASLLKKFIKDTGLSLKSAVNELLKRGLIDSGKKNSPKKYTTKPHDAGEVLAPDIDNIGALMSRLDEEKLK
jgi:hypothetical protein